MATTTTTLQDPSRSLARSRGTALPACWSGAISPTTRWRCWYRRGFCPRADLAGRHFWACRPCRASCLAARSTVPFLMDVEVHVRFLVVATAAGRGRLVVHRRMRPLVAQFLERDLIADEDSGRASNSAIASAIRLRELAFGGDPLIAVVVHRRQSGRLAALTALDLTTWYSCTVDGTGRRPRRVLVRPGEPSAFPVPAYALVLPDLLWARFLWQVSRINLGLVPPIRTGLAAWGFWPPSSSPSSRCCWPMARCWPDLGPPHLLRRRKAARFQTRDHRDGGPSCSCLCTVRCWCFRRNWRRRSGSAGANMARWPSVRAGVRPKWLRAARPPDEPLIGSADIQSLADLGNSFEVVQAMRVGAVHP